MTAPARDPAGRPHHGRLRAPVEDRSALMDPPLDEIDSLVRQNVRLSAGRSYDFQGRCLAELSRQARRDLLVEARRHSAAYRDVRTTAGQAAESVEAIFLAGHQPQLFHPGVWLKSFALGHLARRHGAAAVNLLIDSDTIKSTSLSVPGGSPSQPRAQPIPFDLPEPKIPYEQRQIGDRRLFADFGRRVAERIAPLVADPLIEQLWPLVLGRMQQTDNLGACLAQARHRLEGDWGLDTLEIPQSRVCQTEPFSWFAAHLLAQLPRFREVYNGAVRRYRRAHRIRSAAHPVPELGRDGRWLEAPLWVYSTDDPRRRALFAARQGNRVLLGDRQGLEISLPLSAEGDASGAVERLMELPGRGVKIRSRALITTLWARLALGELFVHGIGGAKYDRLTDALIEQFFALRPPRLMVVSATLHLPIERPKVTPEQARDIRRQLRELLYHPERFIDAAGGDASGRDPVGVSKDPNELIAAKSRWVGTPQTAENARARCRAIRRINNSLQPWVEPQRRRLQRLSAQTARALQAEDVLARREYAFCLYPEGTFRGFLHALLPNGA